MAKILVADDNPKLLRLICRNLGQSLEPTPQLLEAADGKAAIRLAWKEKPDLCLLDSNMPVFSGEQVCRELRRDAETASLRILLLRSSFPRPGEFSLTDGYLVKPFTLVELLDKVEQLLG